MLVNVLDYNIVIMMYMYLTMLYPINDLIWLIYAFYIFTSKLYIYIYKRLKWFVKQHQVHKTKW
jgi:hypothetical protein